MFCVIESTHPYWVVITKVGENTPALVYVFTGCSKVELFPSPKFHKKERVSVVTEVLVNSTGNGIPQFKVSAVKLATGIFLIST